MPDNKNQGPNQNKQQPGGEREQQGNFGQNQNQDRQRQRQGGQGGLNSDKRSTEIEKDDDRRGMGNQGGQSDRTDQADSDRNKQ